MRELCRKGLGSCLFLNEWLIARTCLISSECGMGIYTLAGCNPYAARYPSKDWRRMKRLAEAMCHADILGKTCQLAQVTCRGCALRQTYKYQPTNLWVGRSAQDCSHF